MSDETATWAGVMSAFDTRMQAYVTENGSPPPQPGDLITDAQLAKLRAGFDLTDAIASIRWTLNTPYTPASPFPDWIYKAFYLTASTDGPEELSATEREIAQLVLLSTTFSAAGMAIHFYWALAQNADMRPNQLGRTVALAAAYKGIDVWSFNIGVLQKTLVALAQCADDGIVTYDPVLAKIVAAVS
ncbi:MAG: alkylhydroperoxidase/carboxymuconolactone decarboxylase family protein YurZ [Myxococcota bacterium]|jgi:alkylhydroperoxidase/carboxymuconolactone decarboxylase family protein YurZ